MKAIKLYVLLVLISFLSCEKDDMAKIGTSKGIEGYIQKGPFIAGSSITIQTLDGRFSPQGSTFNTSTTNDFGAFKIESQIQSSYIEVITQGFYFNEVTGNLSEAQITLRAISEVSEDLRTNVNILTTLSKNRIVYLVNTGGMSFNDAKKKAQNEILAIFNIDPIVGINFNQMDLSKNGVQNAILLAISSILQGNLSVASLSELVSKIILDIEADGTIDDNELIREIRTNANNLDLTQIRTNLCLRFSSTEIPDFESFAKRLIDLNVLTTFPEDGDKEVNYDLAQIIMRFNKPLDYSSIDSNSIQVYDNLTQNKVSWISEYNPVTYQLTLEINEELLPESNYKVKISTSVKGIDSMNLLTEFSFDFSTVDIDILSNLSIYCPIVNGQLNDISGNNHTPTAHQLTSTADRKGVEGGAVNFAYSESYIKYPSAIKLWNPKWTYTLWVNFAELPAGGCISQLLGYYNTGWPWTVPFSVDKNGKLYMYNSKNYYGNFIFQTQKWYHLSYIVDNQNTTLKLFVDGVEIFSDNDFYFENSTTAECLYLSGLNYDQAKVSFLGSVDDIRFYDRILNKFEIQKLINE
jgi:hypothetical protein